MSIEGKEAAQERKQIPDPHIPWPVGHSPAMARVFAQNVVDVAASPQAVWSQLIDCVACPQWYKHCSDVSSLRGGRCLSSKSKFRFKTLGFYFEPEVITFEPHPYPRKVGEGARRNQRLSRVAYKSDTWGLSRHYGRGPNRPASFLHRSAHARPPFGQIVDIFSHFEGEVRKAPRFAVVPYAIARRNAAAYYPETNVLIPIRSVAAKGIRPHTSPSASR